MLTLTHIALFSLPAGLADTRAVPRGTEAVRAVARLFTVLAVTPVRAFCRTNEYMFYQKITHDVWVLDIWNKENFWDGK